MSVWLIFTLLVFASGFLYLGWASVQSLIQARMLGACRNVSLAGLVGRSAAFRGPVRVHKVLRIAHLGDVLWHREIVKKRLGLEEFTDADTADRAEFSILVGGEEVRVAENPTEVQVPASRTVGDGSGAVALTKERVIDEWLPVVEELTVIGRLRREGSQWEVVRDPKAGLFISRNDPKDAAAREMLKGVFGLIAAVAGLGVIAWLFLR